MNRAVITAAVALALGLGLGATDARADYDFSWEQTDDRGTFKDKMAAARRQLRASGEARSLRRYGREEAQKAYAKLAEALALEPKHLEANYFAAELIYHWDFADYGKRNEWLDKAIGHYTVFIDNAEPGPRLVNALFNRSIMYSKRGRHESNYQPYFRLALRDYERQLRMFDADTSNAFRRRQRAIRSSNAAELYMGIGELDRAIELYIESVDIVGSDAALYLFGLAVALDRDGQRLRAAEIARIAINGDAPDRRGHCSLHRDGVFFVPEGDRSYYLALRAEALGKNAEARRHYQVFLRRRGKSNYAEVARRNLAALRNVPDTYKPSGKPCR